MATEGGESMSPPLALPWVADQALGAHGHLPMLQYEQLHAVAVPAAKTWPAGQLVDQGVHDVAVPALAT